MDVMYVHCTYMINDKLVKNTIIPPRDPPNMVSGKRCYERSMTYVLPDEDGEKASE